MLPRLLLRALEGIDDASPPIKRPAAWLSKTRTPLSSLAYDFSHETFHRDEKRPADTRLARKSAPGAQRRETLTQIAQTGNHFASLPLNPWRAGPLYPP